MSVEDEAAKVGATGCATAWADHVWQQLPAEALAVVSRDDMREALAPLLNGLNADHAARLAAALAPPADDVTGDGLPALRLVDDRHNTHGR
jgi:hypothetical protein